MIDFKEKWSLLNIFGSFFFASNKSTMTNYGLWLTCLVHLLSKNWKPLVNINDLSLTCNKLERTHYCKSFHILLLGMINNLRGHTKLCQCYIVLNGYHLALSHSKELYSFSSKQHSFLVDICTNHHKNYMIIISQAYLTFTIPVISHRKVAFMLP